MLPFPLTQEFQAHHESSSNLSETQISDTLSESSDNATIISLSGDDLNAIGAGPIREDIRVSRKKLESLILREREYMPEKNFMDSVMDTTKTFIQWPTRMKIGAKTKKDLYVRIYGHTPEDVNEAKAHVLAELGPLRDLRITLKMEISYTDHSHLIGCRGATIRKVMEDTGCHIHFPDSNRMSKEHKSNQVTIAGGSIDAVEQARSRVRELSPLIFQFTLPVQTFDLHSNPDAYHIFIDSIQTNYSVQVTIHPPNKLQQTTVSVKGCEVDSARIKDAIGKIITYFSKGTQVNTLNVESTMEISAVQHSFVRAVNDTNVHAIMINTGAKIVFPDLTDGNIQQIKRSRVYIAGEMNSVYFARQQLIGCLPLRMLFDLSDDYILDWDIVRHIGSELNVNIKMINRNRPGSTGGGNNSLPPPVPGRSRTIQLISAERNTGNIYEARRRILGGSELPHIARIPPSYSIRSIYNSGMLHLNNGGGGGGARLHPNNSHSLPPLLLPQSPSIMSPILSPSFWPPTPFASPLISPAVPNIFPIFPGMSHHQTPQSPLTLSDVHQQFARHNNNYGHSIPELRYSQNNYQHNYQQHQMEPPPPLSPFVFKKEPNDFFRDIDPQRKAPGWERSMTQPNLFKPNNFFQRNNNREFSLNTNSNSNSSNNSRYNFNSKSPLSNSSSGMGSKETSSLSSTASSLSNLISSNSTPSTINVKTEKEWPEEVNENGDVHDKEEEEAEEPNVIEQLKNLLANNPNNILESTKNSEFQNEHEKKYMAVKAMYQSKIGTGSRVPNAQWAGYGFSKTTLSLFPKEPSMNENVEKNDNNGNGEENKTGEGPEDNENNIDKVNDLNNNSDENPIEKTLLAPRHSNLLDFSMATNLKATDLPMLFLQNGLEKYIDIFLTEEIDLSSFTTLVEEDLKTVGVTSYPARKKMLLLINLLNCARQDYSSKSN